MKKILFLLLLSSPCFAGTGTFSFGTGGGTITISSGTVASAGPDTIVVDTQTKSVIDGGTSPLTWSITLGQGSSAADKYVTVGCATTGSGVNSTAVSVGTQNLDLIHNQKAAGGQTFLWGSTHTLTGAQTISVSYDAGTNGNIWCGAISLTGVAQTSSVDVSSGATSSGVASSSVTFTTNFANEVLVDVIMTEHNDALSSGVGQTQAWMTQNASQGTAGEGSSRIVTAATAYTIGGWGPTATTWHNSAASLKPGP